MELPDEVPFCKRSPGSRMVKIPRLTEAQVDALIREAHAKWSQTAKENQWSAPPESVVVWVMDEGTLVDSLYVAGPTSQIVLDTNHDHCGEDCNGGTTILIAERATAEAPAG